jgi:hypothetical protein
MRLLEILSLPSFISTISLNDEYSTDSQVDYTILPAEVM